MKLGDVWMRPFFNPIQDVYRSTLHVFIVLILGFLSLQSLNAATPDFSKVVDTTQDSFLPVEQAFSLKVQPDQNQAALNLKWTIAPNYSLYRDRIHVEVFTPKDVTIDTSELAGHMVWKQDPNFGRVAVFHDAATMKVGITHLGSSQPETVQIKLRYQGCADSGLCFPPVDEVLTIHPKGLKLVSATSIKKLNTTLETISPVKNKDENYDLNNASSLAAFLNHASVPLILLTLLVLGAGLAFTPCVFPMMPILSGLIAGEKSERLTGWRGFKLSLAYVLGMAHHGNTHGVFRCESKSSIMATIASGTYQLCYFIYCFGFRYVWCIHPTTPAFCSKQIRSIFSTTKRWAHWFGCTDGRTFSTCCFALCFCAFSGCIGLYQCHW